MNTDERDNVLTEIEQKLEHYFKYELDDCEDYGMPTSVIMKILRKIL